MTVLVIPDIHGKPDLLVSMLAAHPDVDRIIQIGDLVNCVWDDRDGDLECLALAKERGFELLVGNHEHPYFGGPRFAGFESLPEVGDAIKALKWQAAAVVGDFLVTHAGMAPRLASADTPDRIAAVLNDAWKRSPTHSYFSDIGQSRGGWEPYGGILWRDISEPIDTRVRQVFGHSKGKGFRFDNHDRWVCIDAEIPCLFSYDDEEERWRAVAA